MSTSAFGIHKETKPALLEEGERVLVIERRSFEQDARRHFVGRVDVVDKPCFRASGTLFVYHKSTKKWVRRQGTRTRVYSMTDGRLNVCVLPHTVNLTTLTYTSSEESALILTDGQGFVFDLHEFSPRDSQ